MVEQDRTRIIINMGKNLNAKLNEFCEETGSTKSNVICVATAEFLADFLKKFK